MSITLNKCTTPKSRSLLRSFSHHNSNNGFTLIEVLVSLVIVAIGLLGLAGMQIYGMQGNNGALQRTQASFIANDIATRMRVNTIAMDAKVYADADYSVACSTLTPPDCVADSCTSSELAEADIANFICATEDNLPNPSNTNITCADNDITDANDCSIGSPHTISFSWVESITIPGSNTLADANRVSTISLVVRP